MKKIWNILLIVIFSLSIFTYVFADGDANVDGGGGDMGGGGTSGNVWNPSWDGIRISVYYTDKVDGEYIKVGRSFDMSNKSGKFTGKYIWNAYSKLDYKQGYAVATNLAYSTYTANKPNTAIPYIVNSDTYPASASKIKTYIQSKEFAETISIAKDSKNKKYIGLTYDELTSGEYKVLVEPIAYFTFSGNQMAMTATEVAYYDKMATEKGYPTIRSKLVSLSHKNLPLAMFLETSDLGFSAYSGSTTSPQSNDTIISKLGLATVSYKSEPQATIYDYGIRISILDKVANKTIGKTNHTDYSNKAFTKTAIDYTYNKHDYINNKSLTPNSGNYSNKVWQDLPTVVTTDESNNKRALINYMNNKDKITEIAQNAGLTYEQLSSTRYYILVEPIVHFKNTDDKVYVMSSTEIAMWNKANGNKLSTSNVADLTHKHIPMSMYLANNYNDVGLKVPGDSSYRKVSDDTIIKSFGMMILSFKEDVPEHNKGKTYEMRENTEVIVSTKLMSTAQIDDLNEATVTFKRNGQVVATKKATIPAYSEQYVYFKWTTPNVSEEDGKVVEKFTVETTEGYLLENTIVCNVNDYTLSPLPKTSADDKKGGWHFKYPSEAGVIFPLYEKHMWSEYSTVYDETLDIYDYNEHRYWANIHPITDIKTTAMTKEFRSGYGFSNRTTTNFQAEAPNNSYTSKNARVVSYFPEFNYDQKLARPLNKSQGTLYEFDPNRHCIQNTRNHFTPIWYPDGDYQIITNTFDYWSPVGELAMTEKDTLEVIGSLFDDYSTRPNVQSYENLNIN